jgi:hypothetical protein
MFLLCSWLLMSRKVDTHSAWSMPREKGEFSAVQKRVLSMHFLCVGAEEDGDAVLGPQPGAPA